jgi:hypothetical protein
MEAKFRASMAEKRGLSFPAQLALVRQRLILDMVPLRNRGPGP